jgi:glycosyltransferase involved in cell wall biosynthesis
MHDKLEQEHFDATVRPFLGDDIEYVGEVSHEEKVQLLQRALLTVFPIQWPEPFGLVMVESMACGTPVLATGLGAVPEVVEQRRGGIVADTVDELIPQVQAAIELDRREVRAVAEEKFSAERMVEEYEEAYERLIAG